MTADSPAHMTSQDHRERAMTLLGLHGAQVAAEAQLHATLAVYEGLYELLGDGSSIDDFVRRSGA